MTRLFLSLYFLIVVTVIGFFFLMMALVNWPLSAIVKDDLQNMFNGPKYIIEQHLQSVEPALWRAELQTLSAEFGYQTNVFSIAEIANDKLLAQEDVQRLEENLVVYHMAPDNHPDMIFMPIEDSDLVLRQADSELPRERGERTAGGYLVIAEKILLAKPQPEWQSIIDDMQQEFVFPVSLVDLDNVAVESEDRTSLLRGDVVGYDFDQDTERYFKKVGDSDVVFKVGPIPNHPLQGQMNFVALGLLASSFALMVFLWIRPLWRDLRALEAASMAFGEGKLDTVVNIKKRAASAQIGGAFNQMTQRIRTLISSHKELTDAVSHELRTPIARMQFGIDMLRQTDRPEDRERYLRGLGTDVNELESLVDELLLYSRLERVEPELKFEKINLAVWLHDVLDEERREDSSIVLSMHTVEKSIEVDADAKLLRRAVANIIRNAYRYAEDSIVVTASKDNNHLDIAVCDDGPGIPAEDRDKVFDAFTRLDSSRNRDSGGYGLGLAIVTKICAWHHGEVSVDTASEGGACFRIRMPLEQ